MSATSTSNSIEPFDGSAERERLARAYEQIRRADEELTRLSEQVAKMQRAPERPASAGPERRSAPGRPALRALVGLPLAACVVVAAIAFQSSHDGGTRPVIASSPQPGSTLSSPPENSSSPAQPALSIVQAAAAQTAPPQAAPAAENPPHETAPAPTAAIPDQTQLLQTMARDLANLERSIEQLKATQQQMASDNAKDIAELKASEEEIKRVLAKVSEQSSSKASPPPSQPAQTLHKPERTVQPPRARARPRREWMDDDW